MRRGISAKRLANEGKNSIELNPSGSLQFGLNDLLGQNIAHTLDIMSEKSQEKHARHEGEAPSPTGNASPLRKKKKIHLKKSNRERASARRSKKNVAGLSAEKCPMEPRIVKGASIGTRMVQAGIASKHSHGQYQSTLQNSQSSGQNSSMLSSDREDERAAEVEQEEETDKRKRKN